MQKAINYIEANLETNLHETVSVKNIADHVYSSSDYFQKMFLMVTGFTVSEYIRNRKLSLAGRELSASKSKVVDVALKYGYETHESFCKAFVRFHGFSPSKVRSSKSRLKYFNPFTIEVTIKGGFDMSEKVTFWEENNLKVHIHNNTDLAYGGWEIKDPSSKEIEEAIEKLGKSKDAPDFDFVIMNIENEPRIYGSDEMYIQGGFSKDSGEYLVEAQCFHYYADRDDIDYWERRQYDLITKDVSEMQKVFTDFALGIAPDVTDWKLTVQRGPKEIPENN